MRAGMPTSCVAACVYVGGVNTDIRTVCVCARMCARVCARV